MLSSILTTLIFTSLAASQAICPIKAYDARPGYGIMCVRGDAYNIYENELISDLTVNGGTYDATLRFECLRRVGNANWLGYNYGGKLCWVTEGNVEGEDRNPCFSRLPACNPYYYDSGRAGEYVPPGGNAGSGFFPARDFPSEDDGRSGLLGGILGGGRGGLLGGLVNGLTGILGVGGGGGPSEDVYYKRQ